jgi:DNA-binding XRE family transcriptional regulator
MEWIWYSTPPETLAHLAAKPCRKTGRKYPCGLAAGVQSPREAGEGAEREARGFTLSELAERAGLTRQTVRRVERETRMPSVDVIVRLALALGGKLARAVRNLAALAGYGERAVNGHIRPVTERRPAA